jgi:tetratricopeptide (TPR) repeat protein
VSLTDRLRFYRAYVAYESGASKRALRLFREYVRTASETDELPSAYYYLGLLYADQDADTEAKNYLRQLVDQYPNSEHFPVGALRLGDINADQENYEAAASAYRKAAENDRTGPELRAQARYGQGMALLRLDRTDEAETLLRDILRGDQSGPVRTSARLGLARIHESEGRTQEALKLYRSVLNAADGETGAEALFRLGSLLRNQGQLQQAVEELQRMPSLFAGYPEWNARALLEQARSYRQMGQTGQAVKLYEEVTTSHAGTPYAETAREERSNL